ncbi:hypothetical protein [Clostridium saccharoperbutylacetonicum]|uniref:hypothetical protein n=1 Tax=Clostridium saccharoperbutylacetonicum TaxID=36745 RepID=UPI000983B77A|nr:hypothetical protein [Clostridium saccharoperbutylacetonicum]AQR98236.1 hypothetical protein CLSAP_55980 [Clostridium saccharoperbutylacetonicum]NSB34131.1 hypothetical protein [Clostridium saccharoperbutylacetonicum]
MSELLIPISDFEFKNNVNIRFDNILDGFNLFENFTIDASNIEDGEKLLIKFIEEVFEKNNSEAYIDFYIAKLSNEDRSRLAKLIHEEDIKTLELHLNLKSHDGVFYLLKNKSLIPFLVRLNTREVFFTTFYFTNNPITIWGNYNLKFPCFVGSKENLNFYSSLSKSLAL